MSRRVIAVATIVLLATSAPAMAGVPGGHAASKGPISIAVEGPQSGSQSSNGLDQLRGVQLAVAQVNADGGVLGRMVQIVRADDKADPGLAASVANTVIDGGSVAVIGPYNSSVGIVNLPLYMKGRVIPVQMTSTDDTTGMGVTVQPKNSQISPLEYAYITRAWAPSKVPMLVNPSTYTKGMADRLQARLEKKGVLVTRIPVTEGQADYTAVVSQALTNNPTVVYLSTYFPAGAKIAAALRATGNPARCFAGLANQDPGFVTAAGVAASRRCMFSGVPGPAQLPTARTYVRRYRAAFARTPGTWGTFTYDSARILFAAMRRAGTTAYAPVLRELRRTRNFPGATGRITINSVGNRPDVPVRILRVSPAGAFVVVPAVAGT